jgi:membrane-bound lytic murein transglycosylase D
MKLKRFLITIFFAILSSGAFAINDTIILKSEIYSEKITRDLDSLVNSWYVKMAMKEFSFEFDNDSTGKEYPDSLYQARLRKVNSIIKLPYNSIIRNHIHVYTVKQRDKFSAVLGLMTYYFPMIEDIFDSYGIPVELKYMAVIESALNANAVSRVRATGMWQFMYSTRRFYGTINSLVDERRILSKRMRLQGTLRIFMISITTGSLSSQLITADLECQQGNKTVGQQEGLLGYILQITKRDRGYIRNITATYAVNYFAEHKIRPFLIYGFNRYHYGK